MADSTVSTAGYGAQPHYENSRTQRKHTHTPQKGDAPPKQRQNRDSVEISDAARNNPTYGKPAYTEKSVGGSISVEVVTDESTGTAAAPDILTREGRDEIAANYDSVLASLREQYDETEALTRFHKYMESEGYEIAPAPANLNTRIDDLASGSAMSYSDPYHGLTFLFGETGEYLSQNILPSTGTDSNLVLQSRLHAATVGDNVELYAESTAYYRVNSKDESGNAFNFVYQKKITDTFETGADSFIADAFAQYGGAEDKAMKAAMENAAATGKSVESTISREEYEATLPKFGSTLARGVTVEPFTQTITIMQQDEKGDWYESRKVTYDADGNEISTDQKSSGTEAGEEAEAGEPAQTGESEKKTTGNSAFDSFLEARASGLNNGELDQLRNFFASLTQWMSRSPASSSQKLSTPHLLLREELFNNGTVNVERFKSQK